MKKNKHADDKALLAMDKIKSSLLDYKSTAVQTMGYLIEEAKPHYAKGDLMMTGFILTGLTMFMRDMLPKVEKNSVPYFKAIIENVEEVNKLVALRLMWDSYSESKVSYRKEFNRALDVAVSKVEPSKTEATVH